MSVNSHCGPDQTDPWRGQQMAKPTLQDQSIDFSKPFIVGLWIDGQYVEKVTHPLKSMVRNMRERGLVAPWDTEVK